MWIYLDDFRTPEMSGYKAAQIKECEICRTAEDAKKVVLAQGCPDFISFDHDLGEGPTGYDFARWLTEEDAEGRIQIPKDFTFRAHSANPVGARNITDLLNRYLERRGA